MLLRCTPAARERERRDWEQREVALMQQEEEEQARRAAHRNAVKELSGLTQVRYTSTACCTRLLYYSGPGCQDWSNRSQSRE